MFETKKMTFYSVVAVLLCGAIWFGMLGHRDLFDPDEGRYAEIPAEMVSSGDWLTPRLNGYKYFEKPALQYWGTAAIYQLLGKNNASARLWPALMGFSTALFVMFLSYQLYGRRAAYYTFLITISSLMVVALGHILTLDMTLAMFIIAGIGSLVIAQINRANDTKVRNWMLVGWAMLALGTLTKGLVALVLPAASVVVYSIWQRDIDIWKKSLVIKGPLLFLLIVSPWFVAVSNANPEFAQFFFIHEHLERYTSGVHKREGPIYYFIPYLILGVCPWLVISMKSIFSPGFKWKTTNPGAFHPERFLWTFVVVTFCFYSLGQSKLPAYILPIIPIIAVISGGRLAGKEFVGADRWVLLVLGLVLVITSLNLHHMASDRYPLSGWVAYKPWLLASGLLFFLASSCLFVLNKKPLIAFVTAAFISLASVQLIILGQNALAETRSSRLLVKAITDSVPVDTPVFSYRTFPESAAFYLGQHLNMVNYAGELKMGIKSEPEKHLANLAELEAKWQNLETAVLILKVKTFDSEILGKIDGEIVYRGPKRMVIVKS